MLPQKGCGQRKRPRELIADQADESQLSAKRQRRQSKYYPPHVWDQLSRITLTRKALNEFDRRIRGIGRTRPAKVERIAPRLLRSDTRRLELLASNGGPDLSRLRGYAELPTAEDVMKKSDSGTSKRQRDSGLVSSRFTSKTGSTGPYDPQFEQLLIDNGVYPDGYRMAGGGKPPKPRNVDDIHRRLSQPRPSLSPSQFCEGAFEEFQDRNRAASSEQLVMEDVMPTIRGDTGTTFYRAGNTLFNNLIEFTPDIADAKADGYDGARPSDIDLPVRRELNGYIVPSTRNDLPAVPNHLTEVKGAAGRADHLRRQAMYAGVVGARGMFQLQNYGKDTPLYDDNAYTLVPAYHAGTGTLQMYATHPVQSANGQTEYYTTQLRSYAMTDTSESFRQGAAALRNSRDISKEQRDSFIASANAVSRARLSAFATPSSDSVGLSPSSSRTNIVFCESDTSTDELAREDEEPIKRQRTRPAAVSNASGDVLARRWQSGQRTRDTSLSVNQLSSANTQDGYAWLGYLFRPLQGGNYTFDCMIRGRAQTMTAKWIPGELCPQVFDERAQEWLLSSKQGQSLQIYARGRWIKLGKPDES